MKSQTMSAVLLFVIRRGGRLGNERYEFIERSSIQGIVTPFSFLGGLHQVAAAKNLHVMRQRWLGDLKCLQKHTGAFFAVCKDFHYLESVWVSKRLTYKCCISFIHLSFPHIDNCLCI